MHDTRAKMNLSYALQLICMAATLFGPGLARAASPELIEAARREGRVNWYTTMLIEQFARPVAAAFERKYGVKVEVHRGDVAALPVRIANEGKSGRMQSDVFDGTNTVPALKRLGFVEQWIPETSTRLPAEFRDPDGFWAGTHFYVLTPGINTELVTPGSEPKTFEDLLNPRWKGKMVWSASPVTPAGPGFIGLVLTLMGEENGMNYLRQLARQDVTGIHTGVRQVFNKVIAGEFSIGLQMINNHAIVSRAQGAPAGWIPMQPASAVLSGISVTKGAPHPNAGKLLTDFIVSREGQEFIRDAEYMPVDSDVPLKHPEIRPDGNKFRAIYFKPEEVDAGMPRWQQVYNELFK